MEHCDECGFAYDLSIESPVLVDAIAARAEELAIALMTTNEPSQRRLTGTWSPLEYCCHVRDVLLVQRERVLLARRRETPSVEPMGRDERAEHDGYADQRPGDVARQLRDAALMFANVLGRLSDAERSRTLIYNYPELTERTLWWVGVHTLHELVHHLLDVTRVDPLS